ncbi:signal recognition particle protein [Eisenibacter elegans]|jgi:signal recognition particle subunit SRP54|uniref:signal recognition particle protein n=1 Tax=Eisenibacter elegans TaxID=997 RepID=UPI0004117E1A|nr:signal recognition particle protein [Eisenibacter elegans]
MFENLSDRLDKAMKTLKGQGRITDINVASTVKEIRRALVEADVNYKVAKEVTDRIKQEALGRKILIDVQPGQMLVKIVHEELTRLMGQDKSEVKLEGDPAVVLMSGLQGSGKTTFSGKLANYYKKQGRNVLLVACDIYRPAAIAQLQTLGQQIGVEVYAEPENKNAVSIATNAIAYAKANKKKLVIVDTAGRLAVDEEMMNEIAAVKAAIKPSETLFVVDSMTGQDAVNTAQAFNERINFDGVVLTKLDGDTRGGAALSIRAVVDKPIKFNSRGEKMDDIEQFFPDRMASRILNMGDVLTLVDKMQEVYDEKMAEELNRKMRKNQFDFNDFLQQIQQIKKMGGVKDVMSMIPGMSKMMKDVDVPDDAFKSVEAMIFSMTPTERANPEIIDGSRRKRIAQGSGVEIQDLNRLLKQFEEMKKMMKKVNKMSMGGSLMGGSKKKKRR